ncbi:hypothetical protein BC833DRAFT_617010 [Globomyces pollinis-pini]|nr:hypothetical protein BC833DRAFT_617010 [Globomyces pollinis-pini]
MLDENDEHQNFIDDGASSHDANYGAQLRILRPYWPPNSPDMNPISGWLKQNLTDLDPVPETLEEFSIYHNSMPDRVRAFLKANGGTTKY